MKFARSGAELRATFIEQGINEPLWRGFPQLAKMGYAFINRTQLGDSTFELRIEQHGSGYKWSLTKV